MFKKWNGRRYVLSRIRDFCGHYRFQWEDSSVSLKNPTNFSSLFSSRSSSRHFIRHSHSIGTFDQQYRSRCGVGNSSEEVNDFHRSKEDVRRTRCSPFRFEYFDSEATSIDMTVTSDPKSFIRPTVFTNKNFVLSGVTLYTDEFSIDQNCSSMIESSENPLSNRLINVSRLNRYEESEEDFLRWSLGKYDVQCFNE